MTKILRLETCKEANKEHRDSCRQYAHVYHKKDVICVAEEFYSLPETIRLALMLHEVGHILAGPKGGEEDANRAVWDVARIRIYYLDTRHGEELEWIKPRDKEKAKEFLSEYLSGDSLT